MAASDDMLAFSRIAELGSFARAADDLGVTPSALSKLVTRLEGRLGIRLMNRTTRRLNLTPEGVLYLSRARDVLAMIERAEQEVSAFRETPRGHLRINTGTAVAAHISAEAIPQFLARYPEISIELAVTDRTIDPVAEHVDIALRTGYLPDSELVTRKLADLRRVICAAPAYLEKHGIPRRPADLLNHNCLVIAGQTRLNAWPFVTPDGINRLEISGNFASDNVGILFAMALGGLGIVRLADFVVGQAIRDGRLVELLADTHRSEEVPLWAVMPAGRHRAPRVQAFLDFVADRLRTN